MIQLGEKDDIRDEEQTNSEGCAVSGYMANVEINEGVEVESSDEVKRQLEGSYIITGDQLSVDKVEQSNVNEDRNEIAEVESSCEEQYQFEDGFSSDDKRLKKEELMKDLSL